MKGEKTLTIYSTFDASKNGTHILDASYCRFMVINCVVGYKVHAVIIKCIYLIGFHKNQEINLTFHKLKIRYASIVIHKIGEFIVPA